MRVRNLGMVLYTNEKEKYKKNLKGIALGKSMSVLCEEAYKSLSAFQFLILEKELVLLIL